MHGNGKQESENRKGEWELENGKEGIKNKERELGTVGGGGYSSIKKVGVHVISLRGVNFRFWSRLGC